MEDLFRGIRLTSSTYSQQAYQVLRQAILDGKLKPGQRLAAKHLTETFGISRTPLREAFQLLEQEGLVRRLPNGIVEVEGLSLAEIEELYLIRGMLEGLACRLASVRITTEQLAQMDKVTEQIAHFTAMGDERAIERFGREFHRIIHEASGASRTIDLLHQMQDHIHRYRPLSIAHPGRMQEAFSEHEEISKALVARDPDAAELAMRTHIMNGGKVVLAGLRTVLSPDGHQGGETQ
ncbi:MAG: GntR family transcriptional regulator [Bacillota bacterium]